MLFLIQNEMKQILQQSLYWFVIVPWSICYLNFYFWVFIVDLWVVNLTITNLAEFALYGPEMNSEHPTSAAQHLWSILKICWYQIDCKLHDNIFET